MRLVAAGALAAACGETLDAPAKLDAASDVASDVASEAGAPDATVSSDSEVSEGSTTDASEVDAEIGADGGACVGLTLPPSSSGKALWAKSYGDVGFYAAPGIATDAAGNVFIGGSFTNWINFAGTGKGGPETLLSAGWHDAFVAKLDPTGKHVWSRGFGDIDGQRLNALTVDQNGNVLIAGEFSGTIAFSGIEAGAGSLVGTGSWDTFVAKLDPNGSLIWAKQFGGAPLGAQVAEAIAVDATGNVYVAGGFDHSIEFGAPGEAGTTGFTNTNGDYSHDAFLAKFDSNGAHVWSQHFGAMGGSASATALAVSPQGKVAIAGWFTETLDFTPDDDASAGLSSGGGTGSYVAVFDGLGAQQWSRGFIGTGYLEPTSVAIDSKESVLVAGGFAGALDFLGIGSDAGSAQVGSGSVDLFLAKFDSSGSHVWGQIFGSPGFDLPGTIAMDAMDNVIFAGGFVGSASFAGIGGSAPKLVTNGGRDVFVAKFDPSGKGLWNASFGSGGSEYAYAVSVERCTGTPIFTSFFSTSTTTQLLLPSVGNVGDIVLTSGGGSDFFVARLAP